MKPNIRTLLAFAALAAFVLAGCADKSTKVEATPGDKPAVETAKPAEPSKPKITDESVKAPETKPQPPAAEEKKPSKTAPAKEEAVLAKVAPELKDSALKTIYFDYDKSNIKDDAKAALDGNFEHMNKNGGLKVVIVGHCDERGTSEYNMALGDRRANSTKTYLVNRGVTSDRMETLSKGKEEPADPGHNEEAWAKNRRAEFKTRN